MCQQILRYLPHATVDAETPAWLIPYQKTGAVKANSNTDLLYMAELGTPLDPLDEDG